MKQRAWRRLDVPAAFLAAAGLVVLAAVLYAALVRPLGGTSSELDGWIAAADAQIASLQASLEPSAPAPDAIRVADVVELARAMPDDDSIAAAILELDAYAKSAGVEFISITPGSAQAGGGFTRVPLSVSFVGSYYDLTDLVYRLRQLVRVRDGELAATGRLFTIDSVNWHEPSIERFPAVQADLVISAYVYGVDTSLLQALPGQGATTPAATTPTTTEPASTQPQTSTGPDGSPSGVAVQQTPSGESG